MNNTPLAQKLRPKKLNEICGQKHILGDDGLLTKIIDSREVPNLIFYGPPGTGKTTVAQIISEKTNKRLYKLNATTANLSDIKEIVTSINPIITPNGVLLYLDEIQYFNKKQQQSLLEFLENGQITLIASTTENPYFYIYSAILSRCHVFEFKPVENEEIKKALERAVKIIENSENIKIKVDEKTFDTIAKISGGDVRKAINMFEICLLATETKRKTKNIDYAKTAEVLQDNSFFSYNKTGDDHFDLLSAFQKSLRGSDIDASIYYLARLLDAGELTSICRRLMVCACEDVGLAYPQIIPIVKSCVDIALQVGMPESRIPLADAVVMVASSPKSNSAYKAISTALKDIKSGKIYQIPRHLQNIHCDSSEKSESDIPEYKYPHDFKSHWVNQQYLPSEIKNVKYYYPGENKNEKMFAEYIKKLKS
ncbi:MAG: replication-associated recombination protein A [Clostridia bacterium]|nr:replication-associated recombination protein A [Clostridia bacterium]